jgi:hypothetical protein
MTFESNEFTVEELIAKLTEKFGQKRKGGSFTKNDIAQYERKGRIPHFYGNGNTIATTKKHGVKIITVEGEL